MPHVDLFSDCKKSTIYRLWCYVDVEKCPLSKDKCVAAGGVVGSEISPYCRTRQHVQTTVDINASSNLYYSYATCGDLDLWTNTGDGSAKFIRASGGHNLIVSVPQEDYPPWVFKAYKESDKKKTIWRGYTGVQPIFTGQQAACDPASCRFTGCSSCLVT